MLENLMSSLEEEAQTCQGSEVLTAGTFCNLMVTSEMIRRLQHEKEREKENSLSREMANIRNALLRPFSVRDISTRLNEIVSETIYMSFKNPTSMILSFGTFKFAIFPRVLSLIHRNVSSNTLLTQFVPFLILICSLPMI